MMKRPWVFHPFVLAAYPTLYFYSKNLRTIGFTDVLSPLGLTLAATVGLFAILRAFRLDGPRAGLIASGVLALGFSFSHGVRLAERWDFGSGREIRGWFVLGLEGAALVPLVALVGWRPGLARGLNDACNASSIALALMTTAGIIGSEWGRPAAPSLKFAGPVVPPRASPIGRDPDVYFLVLDAYGRSDVLKEIYDFDNSGTLDRLERKGFVVAREGRSNYCQTALSLTATLNLGYLDDLAGNPTNDRRPLRERIADNAVFRAFRERGYRLVTFASGFDATESFDVDLILGPDRNLRTFHALIANQTPLWLLLGQQASREPHRLHRDRALKVFGDLAVESHPSTRPTFTFAHVVSPHPPFIFGDDGRDVSGQEASYSMSDSEGWCEVPGHGGPEDYARRYREQVQYVTGRVEQAVERILATSPEPPIIIIQGDHGPGSHFDSAAERPNDVRERFGILNACYLPESGRSRIGPKITPINTMRAVLDECLGTKLGPIEDRSFYSSFETPYLFFEVTDQLAQ